MWFTEQTGIVGRVTRADRKPDIGMQRAPGGRPQPRAAEYIVPGK